MLWGVVLAPTPTKVVTSGLSVQKSIISNFAQSELGWLGSRTRHRMPATFPGRAHL